MFGNALYKSTLTFENKQHTVHYDAFAFGASVVGGWLIKRFAMSSDSNKTGWTIIV